MCSFLRLSFQLFHTLGIEHSSFDRISLATNRFTGSTLYLESPYQDTAGQERFNNLHPSYFYKAHACVMAFDVTRKVTYKNLDRWYAELQEYCRDPHHRGGEQD